MSRQNRIKRWFYTLLLRTHREKFNDVQFLDECTIELRDETYKGWQKDSVSHTVNGSVGKDAHNVKINVCAAISRKGPTKIAIFKKNMNAIGFQDILRKTIKPFVKKNFPFGHRLIMDNCKSHTAFTTRIFMLAENITHFTSPPQSPVS